MLGQIFTKAQNKIQDPAKLYENDEDAYFEVGIPAEENLAGHQRIVEEPPRYLSIPGLDHGDHHDILKRILRSEWTDDCVLQQTAAQADSGSIGRWKRDVSDHVAVQAIRLPFAYQTQQYPSIQCRPDSGR